MMSELEAIIGFFQAEKFERNNMLKNGSIEYRLVCEKGTFYYNYSPNSFSVIKILILVGYSDFDDCFLLTNPTLKEIKQLYAMYKRRIN